jgi:hypothetical protein
VYSSGAKTRIGNRFLGSLQGSLAAPEGQASEISASRRIAELPWTQISGEFSSQFGQYWTNGN